MRLGMMPAAVLSLGACGGMDAGGPPSDGSFELVADVRIGSGLDVVTYNGATFGPQDQVHIDVTYASVVEAAPPSGPGLGKAVLSITHESTTVDFDYGASCGDMYGTPYMEIDEADMAWLPGASAPSLELDGMCETPTMTFRFSS